MTEKNKVFAFVAGEVSPEFYGRRDLVKYPLGCKTVENFLVDYRGGLVNRPGHEFLMLMSERPHRWFRFRTATHDLALLFLPDIALVFRDGKLVMAGPESETNDVDSEGVVDRQDDTITALEDGDFIEVTDGSVTAYLEIDDVDASALTILSPVGVPVSGSITYSRAYKIDHGFSGSELADLKFYQDIDTIVVTTQAHVPVFIERTADDNWTVSNYSNVLPAAPTGLTVTESASGGASVTYAVSAVIDGVESPIGTPVHKTGVVNFTTTTGYMSLTWDAVAGAERYNIYRTLVFPSGAVAGTQFGYLGFAVGTAFSDLNITPDFTKGPVEPKDFFDGGNNPAVYCRFQQRGVYAGLVNQPLTVVSSVRQDKRSFSVSFPQIDSDSYEHTIDGQVEVPIKHMLPLRYGLLLFTDEGITQLKGQGNSTAITPNSAIAEPQGYTSVSDLEPTAINLDILFLSALGTEVNAMLYTEYTNSFKMQDLAVLSAHLFGPDNLATQAGWAPEPHKVLHYLRQDGQRVTLTYERAQEIFGWARHRTQGEYLDFCTMREDRYNYNYYTIRRTLGGVDCMTIERDRPRVESSYEKTWFVDCGVERELTYPAQSARLSVPEDQSRPDAVWSLQTSDVSWASENQRLYVKGGLFRVTEVDVGELTVNLVALDPPANNRFYDKGIIRASAGEWGYAYTVGAVDNLWFLEGEYVSVQADGDVFTDLLVQNGRVEFDGEGARILVGLPYKSRMESLPLGLSDYLIEGQKLTVRGMAIRQNNSRGLAVGRSFDPGDLEELDSRRYEAWGNPLERWSELTEAELWGVGGWQLEATICMEQKYPLPMTILGYTYDLDVGDA